MENARRHFIWKTIPEKVIPQNPNLCGATQKAGPQRTFNSLVYYTGNPATAKPGKTSSIWEVRGHAQRTEPMIKKQTTKPITTTTCDLARDWTLQTNATLYLFPLLADLLKKKKEEEAEDRYAICDIIKGTDTSPRFVTTRDLHPPGPPRFGSLQITYKVHIETSFFAGR